MSNQHSVSSCEQFCLDFKSKDQLAPEVDKVNGIET